MNKFRLQSRHCLGDIIEGSGQRTSQGPTPSLAGHDIMYTMAYETIRGPYCISLGPKGMTRNCMKCSGTSIFIFTCLSRSQHTNENKPKYLDQEKCNHKAYGKARCYLLGQGNGHTSIGPHTLCTADSRSMDKVCTPNEI